MYAYSLVSGVTPTRACRSAADSQPAPHWVDCLSGHFQASANALPMKLSFIVPAHNEQHYIAPTLLAILAAAQAVSVPFEVLVVNDASTDATAQTAAAMGARVIEADLRNIAAVRNEGARQSQGDVLFFVDADTQVNADVVKAALAALAAGAIGGGANFRYDGSLPFYVRLGLPYLQRRFSRKKVMLGVFLFCTRQGFDAIGGFDEKYYAAEDVYFCKSLRKIGLVVRLEEAVLTSGRKFRDHAWWRLLLLAYNLRQSTPHGRAWVQNKRNLGFWYGRNAK